MTYGAMPEHLKLRLGSRGKAARQLAPELKKAFGLD
jgi:hypothetical protein